MYVCIDTIRCTQESCFTYYVNSEEEAMELFEKDNAEEDYRYEINDIFVDELSDEEE